MFSNDLSEKWLKFNNRFSTQFSKRITKYFSFDETEEDLDFSVCNRNNRTFYKKQLWKQRDGTDWRRVGLFVFDFRGHNLNGQPPEGDILISRKYGENLKVYLKLRIETASINYVYLFSEKDDAFHPSVNCGRAIMEPLKMYIKDNRRKNRKRRKNQEEDDEEEEEDTRRTKTKKNKNT